MYIITEDLEKKLREEDEFDEKTIIENQSEAVYTAIDKYMSEKNIQRSELIRRLNLERTYGYQILNGTRIPTRIHIIKIGLVLELTLDEIQRLLKIGGKEVLYARNITDARAIYAIEHHFNYEDACEFIWNNNIA
ncbi:MAG: helix-turn-helix transcriptional regulator [Oscillospiraceae bacterium]|nr:helix-turn-helix transcriptional regulator [Oscillospiraceae bacterium]